MENAKQARTAITRLVAQGRMSPEAFMALCQDRGWSVLKEGRGYITAKHNKGGKFKIRFPVGDLLKAADTGAPNFIWDHAFIATASSCREYFNSCVAAGKIDRIGFKELCELNKWEIVRETQQSLSVLHPEGKRFRVTFNDDFGPCIGKRYARKGFCIEGGVWIYGLIAHNKNGKRACYIGKSNSINQRINDHIKSRSKKASYYIKQWAYENETEIKVILLAHAQLDRSESSFLEGYWLKLAIAAGYETPGADKWGNLPQPDHYQGMPEEWAEDLILNHAQLLSEFNTMKECEYMAWAKNALFSCGDMAIHVNSVYKPG